ncbi:efflux RND transporter permease subunit [Rhodophyticola sp. CCM32]|uniref:efflux RND transporter permease subunit n=1 Tax=Rhodophyticola sp. CCM32 TaxID=2916397 RepID=UPI00107FAE3B|nr:efflux RND transporter permease subunit [Rhodophyticola sp. CCM32]QBY01712.1 efflux RND transporter permease subunit [Rhodophyticola sp. CCM32]
MRRLPLRAGGVLSYFTRHRTAANLLLVMLIILGLAAFPNMRAQFFPDVVVDEVSVTVTWEGAGAEDVDEVIIAVMEPRLLVVEGVTESSSTAREGRALIELEFEPGWDMGRAADDVQATVDTISDLPEDADDPSVRRGAWRDRVTDVVISGPVSVDQIGRFADEFVARLFVSGVTRATIRGVAAPETIVEVPSAALIRHDISMSEIAEAIAAEADTAPAGDVDSANARVRTGTARRSAEQIAGIVLRNDADGSTLTIGQIATITSEGVDRERAYFVGDNPAISIRVDRTDQGDAIGIQETVQSVADEMQLTLPRGVSIDLIRTRAEAISARLNILLDNGLLGLGLVVLLLFLFLNARTAFWVAAGIPVAMLAAIALMYVAGLTFNMISLFALIITLGIVVDDAIVVGEHADFRARTLGEDPVVAAETAANRMAAPVFSATLTTILAFAGLVAVGGRFGELIADIPFTVIVVLTASLVECFIILPNHMAHALAHSARDHWYDWPSRQVNKGFEWVREHLFRPLMRLVIRARYPVLAAVILLLATQIAVFVRGDVTWRFFNAPELSSVSGNFAMLDGATRDDSRAMMREMQRATDTVAARYEAEYGTNPLHYVLAEVGGSTGRGLTAADNKEADLLGSIAIELIDADLRPYSSFQFVADLQDEVRQLPLTEAVSFRGWRGGPGGDALDVQLFGAETDVLKAAAEAVKTALIGFPEISALEDSLAYDREELSLELTPQGRALGFEIGDLGRVLRHRLGGIEAATYPSGIRTGAIRVELPRGELTADFLDRTLLRAQSGEYVPLADIVTVSARTGFSTINRENGLRIVSVTGDVSEDDPTRAEAIMTDLRERILPGVEADYGVSSTLAGLAEQERAFLDDAAVGFALCLIGIYLVLAWIFASWTRPVVVMAVIPFGLIGTIYGHAVWDVPLSMFTVVGLIGMTGIIINDSIVLVTTVDEYAEDRGLIPAILDGTADRLRPVLLTTLTTVLGLAPLLFEGSQQAQFLKPTVITLVYGLGFGLGVVLLVVPAILAMQQDVGKQIRAFYRAVTITVTGRARAPGLGAAIAGLSLAVAALFAATLGAVLVNGEIAAPLAGLMPFAASSATGALVGFVTGTAGLCGLAWLTGALAHGLAQRRHRHA